MAVPAAVVATIAISDLALSTKGILQNKRQVIRAFGLDCRTGWWRSSGERA
jgi:hypothetical protein